MVQTSIFGLKIPPIATRIENEIFKTSILQVNLSLYDLTYKVKIQTK